MLVYSFGEGTTFSYLLLKNRFNILFSFILNEQEQWSLWSHSLVISLLIIRYWFCKQILILHFFKLININMSIYGSILHRICVYQQNFYQSYKKLIYSKKILDIVGGMGKRTSIATNLEKRMCSYF